MKIFIQIFCLIELIAISGCNRPVVENNPTIVIHSGTGVALAPVAVCTYYIKMLTGVEGVVSEQGWKNDSLVTSTQFDTIYLNLLDTSKRYLNDGDTISFKFIEDVNHYLRCSSLGGFPTYVPNIFIIELHKKK